VPEIIIVPHILKYFRGAHPSGWAEIIPFEPDPVNTGVVKKL
jgi:hypothetical protein